jgi:hypothetical protein
MCNVNLFSYFQSLFTCSYWIYCLLTAIWLLPRYNYYGSWPSSGEIDLTESRGNRQLTKNGQNIGCEQSSSTLHFGPFWPLNGYEHAHFEKNTATNQGYDKDFSRFQLEWTPGMNVLTCKLSRAIQSMCLHKVYILIRDHQIHPYT